MATSAVLPRLQFFGNNGRPLVGGRLHTYLAGTSTPATTYTDAANSQPNTNPIVLDARGEAAIYLSADLEYKFVLTDPQGALIYTQEPIYGALWPDGATALREDLALPTGAGLVGFDRDEDYADDTVGTAIIESLTKAELGLERTRTVDDYRLPTDLTDADSLLRMVEATGGTIVLGPKEYQIGQLTLPTYENLRIIGAGMPLPTNALDQLAGGSILIGSLFARASRALLTDFGLDNGSARALPGALDGLICDAPVGQAGSYGMARNVAVMGKSSGTSHGLLMEGFDRSLISNIYVGRHYFGMVAKNRNTIISGFSGDDIVWAGVYMRSSLPAGASNVADGTASNFKISNVDVRAPAGNTTASAVRVEADTASVSRAQISNVAILNGGAALWLQGGGAISDPNVSGITYTNIRADAAQYVVNIVGYNRDCIGSNISGANIKTGRAVVMPTVSYGWNISGIEVSITDAAITSDVCMETYGSGSWNGLVVRNAFRTMKVQMFWADLRNIKTGTMSGNAANVLDGPLVLQNGATSSASPNVASLRILAGSRLQLTGRVSLAASTNTVFATLPATLGGEQRVFAAGSINASSAYATVPVRLNDFLLSAEGVTVPSNYTVDLSGISWAA